jgi:hypothetical protein
MEQWASPRPRQEPAIAQWMVSKKAGLGIRAIRRQLEMSQNQQCCEPDPHEITLTPISIDFGELADLLHGSVPDVGAFQYSPPATLPEGSVSVTLFEKCCNGAPKQLHRYSGDFSGGLGSVQVDGPLFGVPYIASVNLTCGASASVSFHAHLEEACDGNQGCGQVAISGSVNGGVSATLGPGILRAQAVLEAGAITDSAGYFTIGCFQAAAFVGERIETIVSASFSSANEALSLLHNFSA